jgi:metal-responsive CopG/Arc/MetJ family transcriptional regulator
MKIKTSVSLSEEVLAAMDRASGGKTNRSAFLEKAAWTEIEMLRRQKREARDRRILDRDADALNAEALDVLEFQAEP